MTDHSDELKSGEPIRKFIEQISSFFPNVETFNFLTHQSSSGVEKRIYHKSEVAENQLFGKRKWDFEKKLIKSVDEHVAKGQVEKLLFHDTLEPSRLVSVPRDEVNTWLKTTLAALLPAEAISLASKCIKTDGRVVHLPLMDFSCPPTEVYEQFVVDALNYMGYKKGFLVRSGKSFHFYGLTLLTPEDWQAFMSYCILLSPFTDVRYIGHRLISDYSLLRINKSKAKPYEPSIVRSLSV